MKSKLRLLQSLCIYSNIWEKTRDAFSKCSWQVANEIKHMWGTTLILSKLLPIIIFVRKIGAIFHKVSTNNCLCGGIRTSTHAVRIHSLTYSQLNAFNRHAVHVSQIVEPLCWQILGNWLLQTILIYFPERWRCCMHFIWMLTFCWREFRLKQSSLQSHCCLCLEESISRSFPGDDPCAFHVLCAAFQKRTNNVMMDESLRASNYVSIFLFFFPLKIFYSMMVNCISSDKNFTFSFGREMSVFCSSVFLYTFSSAWCTNLKLQFKKNLGGKKVQVHISYLLWILVTTAINFVWI